MRYNPNHVILRAKNGDVIGYDETGLILRLSDEVVADLRARLATPDGPVPVLRDVDGWNVRVEGDWLRFDACLPPFTHTRGYRRPLSGGSVIADAQGPLQAVLTLGGVAASLSHDGAPHYPHHVLAPDDDMGAAGPAGTVELAPTGGLQTLPEVTQASLLADALVAEAEAARRPLPLVAARAETDGTARAADLASGRAMANFRVVLDSLTAAAGSLGTRLRVRAVTLDFGAEDVESEPSGFVQGIRATIADLLDACAARDLARPVILLRCDGGPEAHCRLWQLAAYPAGQPTLVAGPGYAFERDRRGRLTLAGARARARVEAGALTAREAGVAWSCPLPLLAEREGDAMIRATFAAEAPLVLAPAPPLGTCENFGFALSGEAAPAIASVEIAPDDARALLIRASGPVPDGAWLDYATAGPGAVRDDWQIEREGETLHRWAIPARLEVH